MKIGKLVTQIVKHRAGDMIKSYVSCQLMQIFPLITGVLIREVFKCYEKGVEDNTVWIFIALFIAGLLGRMSCVMLVATRTSIYRFTSSAMLRVNLMGTLLDKPGAKTLNKSSGDTLNSFRDDINLIEEFAAGSIVDFMAIFVFASLSLVMLLRINYVATLLVFTPMIAVTILVRKAGSRITRYRKESRRATGIVSSAIGEVFSNIQVVKAYGAEDTMQENFIKLNKDREKHAIKDNMFSQVLSTVTENILSIGNGFILLVMAFSVKSGDFKLGDFTIFLYYMNFISFFIQGFSETLTKYKQAAVSFKNIVEISEEVTGEELVKNAPLYLKKELPELKQHVCKDKDKLVALKVEDLTFRYPETNGGIEGVSFNVEKNNFTVITGRVGSGKTTLVRTLLGLLEKDGGRIYWNGELVKRAKEVMVPPRIAYSPQIPHFFSTTIEENMLMGMERDNVDLEESIVMAVMDTDIDSFSKGMDTTIGTNGVKLSGGQQQRLSAARMFARASEIFVFDDISSALDVETEEQLWERLFDSRSSTCIAVSNRRVALKKADNIILLKDGKVEASGKLEELLEQCEEMRLIWGQSA
jgi:ATP-binding cassette, subfamily B, bacterial